MAVVGRVGFFALLLVVAVGSFGYLIPICVAIGRHRQMMAVFVLNLFLGWTLIGWVVALVWAVSEHPRGKLKNTKPKSGSGWVTFYPKKDGWGKR